jgi:pyruvate,orthophosphate dikinase
MVNEGLISKDEAVGRIEPAHVDQLLRATFDPRRSRAPKIVNGLNASPGAAVGRAVFDADTAVEWVERGEKVILVRIETSPDDFHGMAVAQGIITARGGATSHAAGRRAPDRQAVRRRLVRPARRLRRQAGPLQRAPGRSSRKATG